MTAVRENPRPPSLRVLAVLRPGETVIPGGLASHHWVVLSGSVDNLERTVMRERVNAVIVDMEITGVFDAIQRIRKLGNAAGSVPVALVGQPELSALAADFLQRFGPGLFVARPVSIADLSSKLRSLHEGESVVRRASSPAIAPPSPSATPTSVLRAQTVSAPRRSSPTPFAAPPLRASPSSVASSVATPLASPVTGPSIYSTSTTASSPHDGPLSQAASPSLRPGSLPPTALTPPSLAAPLTSLLRASINDVGGNAAAFELPADTNDELDDLVPPELLEPLDAPFESIAEETSTETRFHTPPGTLPGVQLRRNGTRAANVPGVSPLPLDGDLLLSGSIARYGVPLLLSAASRVRATGVITAQSRSAQWQIAMHAGHVLAVRGARPEDFIGPMLARLGYLPQEAARFAEVPLDAGVRGAAILASRGYLAPDAVAPVLARAAQELLFDLFCLEHLEWEIRPLENSVGIPMQTRAPDALLVHGARARVEPVVAYGALGGDGTLVTLRAEPSAIASLPLTAAERAAALAAKDVNLASILRTHGELVLPALLALHWLQHLRTEGPAHDGHPSSSAPGPERTRLRALVEAARRKDLMAVLGVSPFATRTAVQLALDARRAEVDAIRARSPTAEALPQVLSALDELTRMTQDQASWERYVSALRASSLRDE